MLVKHKMYIHKHISLTIEDLEVAQMLATQASLSFSAFIRELIRDRAKDIKITSEFIDIQHLSREQRDLIGLCLTCDANLIGEFVDSADRPIEFYLEVKYFLKVFRPVAIESLRDVLFTKFNIDIDTVGTVQK